MSENKKTAVFAAAAVLTLAVAVSLRPSQAFQKPSDMIGKEIFQAFDPLSVTDMQITEFDEETAELRPFEVAVVDVKGEKRWRIPSHYNYPADAKDQVAKAAASLLGLKVLGVAGETSKDNELYGVVNPADPNELKTGSSGVGAFVAMKDKDNKELLSLIIGKAVKDRPDQRYVRRPKENVIYVVALNTDNISANFDRWIEKGLLQINPWDLKSIWINDYSVDKLNSALLVKGEMTLDYADQGAERWKLAKDRRMGEDEKWHEEGLQKDEEPNSTKLDEMKNALSDLRIVDVVPKPEGLSADLKGSTDLLKKSEWIKPLQTRGFFVAQIDDAVELYSANGEVRCQMKDGVEYVLRFGDIAADSSATESARPGEKKADEKGKKNAKLNRYLFITADFNQKLLEKPALETVPEKKDEKKTKTAADKNADGKPETKTAANDSKNEGEKKTEASDKKPEADPKVADAELARIEKDNKRKQEEYDDKVAAGKKRVAELNARFADWYYVISDAEYKKIRLERTDVIQKKVEKKSEGDGHDHEFDKIPTLPTK